MNNGLINLCSNVYIHKIKWKKLHDLRIYHTVLVKNFLLLQQKEDIFSMLIILEIFIKAIELFLL